MSHTLRRLRELFDDPLLVRAGGSMVLSPRAESLAVPLRAALASLQRIVAEPPSFDPTTAQRAFRMVSPDLFDVLVLPTLMETMAKTAPGIDLAVSANYASVGDRLATGDIDLAIVPVFDGGAFDIGIRTSPDLRRRALFRDRFRCFVRRGHPLLKNRRKLSATQYGALAHVMVSPSGEGGGVVDVVLAEHQLKRRIALRVPQFATALAIVEKSDLVLTAPEALERCTRRGRLASLAPPVALPQHAITLVWHPRFARDDANTWFRDVVANASSAARG